MVDWEKARLPFPLRYKQGSHFFSDDIWNQGGCPLQQALDFTEK